MASLISMFAILGLPEDLFLSLLPNLIQSSLYVIIQEYVTYWYKLVLYI